MDDCAEIGFNPTVKDSTFDELFPDDWESHNPFEEGNAIQAHELFEQF